jgi:hypothetical protein
MHECLRVPEILQNIFEKLFKKEEEYDSLEDYATAERQGESTLASLATTCRTFSGKSIADTYISELEVLDRDFPRSTVGISSDTYTPLEMSARGVVK